MASSSTNPSQHNSGSSLNSHSVLNSPSEGVPLTEEAKSSRGWLANRRHFLEVLDASIERIENTELSKYSRYKVIIIIATLITIALSCIVPLCMMFGLPMWVPCLILFGFGLSSVLISRRLQTKCKDIQLRYRAFQLYRQQLLSQYPDLRTSTLHKYNITGTKPEKGFLSRLQESLRPDLHETKEDGGVSLDSRLDLAGSGLQHYQTDALLGISGVNSPEWKRIYSQVFSIKEGILKDTEGNQSIREIQKSALATNGENIGKVPSGGILGFAREILAVCGYGINVGIEAKKSIDQYIKCFLNSPTFMSWNAQLSDRVKSYLLNHQQQLDYACKIFQDLSALTAAYSAAQSLENLNILIGCYKQLTQSQVLDQNNITLIHEQHLKLALRDGCDSKLLNQWSGVHQKFSAAIQEKQDKAIEDADLLLVLDGLREQLEKSRKEILGKCNNSTECVSRAEQKLVSYLVGIGDNDSLINNFHKAISLGKSVENSVKSTILQHPERRIIGLRNAIGQMQGVLNRDDWGAVSGKKNTDILQTKDILQNQLQALKDVLNRWEKSYQAFKENKLTGVLLHDFASSHSHFLRLVDSLKGEDTSDEHLLSTINRISSNLKSMQAEVEEKNIGMNPEDIAQLAIEYQNLINELSPIFEAVNEIRQQIYNEGVSEGSMLLRSLVNKEDALSKKTEEKRKELVASAKQARIDARETENQGIAPLIQKNQEHLLSILSDMESFNSILQKDIRSFDTETLVRFSSRMFSSMQSLDRNTYTDLLEILEMQSNSAAPIQIPESSGEISPEVRIGLANHISIIQKKQSHFLEKRCDDLDKMLGTLQKSIDKWGLAKGIISGILGLILCILGALFLAQQALWLVILVCIGLLCVQMCPLFFDHIFQKKMFEKKVLETAKSLLPATKILPSEFDNKDLNRLAKLQENLSLEGFNQSWARSVIHDLENIQPKEKNLKDITKEFRKDAKNLDKRIKRRFKGELEGEQRVLGIPQRETLSQSFLTLNNELKRLEKEKQNVNIEQDALVKERIGLVLEKTKYDNERTHAQSLANKVSKLKSEEVLKEDFESKLFIQNLLRDLIQQKLSQLGTQDIDIAKEAKELHALATVIYSHTSERAEKHKAKKKFKESVLRIANSGSLEVLENYLNISSSQGLCNMEMQSTFSDKILIKPDRAKQGQVDRKNASREEMLKTLGLDYLEPFVRFVSPETSLSGYNQIVKAYQLLVDISNRLERQQSVSPEDYAAAKAALSAYVRKHESLIGLTYGLHAQEPGTNSTVTTMMRELYAARQIVETSLTLSQVNRNDQILHLINSVLDKSSVDKESSVGSIMDILQACVEHLKSNQAATEDVRYHKYLQKLLKFPVSGLYVAFRHAKNRCLLSVTELNNLKETKIAQAEAEGYIQEKSKVFHPYWETAQARLAEIDDKLKVLHSKETGFEREIKLLNLQISLLGISIQLNSLLNSETWLENQNWLLNLEIRVQQVSYRYDRLIDQKTWLEDKSDFLNLQSLTKELSLQLGALEDKKEWLENQSQLLDLEIRSNLVSDELDTLENRGGAVETELRTKIEEVLGQINASKKDLRMELGLLSTQISNFIQNNLG
ncbi:hypothetical protein C10C_0126 [Chlamydia serpentis]|uniref:Uncharacterized protein n=1 Tax=Chlamydia serpentis TaxID=1967782 RepID=A0A2R8FAC2_9CHLA|nr:hypothetical protein [Chlamydia serpentis]SPN73311.1 hypothetical protein C10C_0126 [Chlamydia serpentis]